MLKGAGVSAARVVLCLLWAHPFLYVSLLPCPSFSSPPNPPFQTLACYGRAWAPRAFATDALSAPATNASYFSRTYAYFRTDALSYARACFPARVFLRARVVSRARILLRARVLSARVLLRARVLSRARFLLRARVLSRARFFLRARVFARAFSLRARAPSRARLLCAYAYFTTRRAAAHTPSVRRGFLYSHSTSPTRTQAYVPLPLNCACLPSLVEKTPDGGFPSVPLKADARLLTSFFFV